VFLRRRLCVRACVCMYLCVCVCVRVCVWRCEGGRGKYILYDPSHWEEGFGHVHRHSSCSHAGLHVHSESRSHGNGVLPSLSVTTDWMWQISLLCPKCFTCRGEQLQIIAIAESPLIATYTPTLHTLFQSVGTTQMYGRHVPRPFLPVQRSGSKTKHGTRTCSSTSSSSK